MKRSLFIQAPSRLLNPTLAEGVIEDALSDDKESARSEWLGQFREDISAYLPDELIDAAVVADRVQLPAEQRYEYRVFCDPSGGVNDRMTMGIAHSELNGRQDKLVLDLLLAVSPPFKPGEVVRQFTGQAERYRAMRIVGDRYAAEWVVSAFSECRMTYTAAERDKSAIYLEALPLFAERRVELLDDPKLLTELRLLERRPRSGGRGDLIDHPPRAHDDLANAAIGALWLASLSKARTDDPLGDRRGVLISGRHYDPFASDRRAEFALAEARARRFAND